MPTLEAVTLYAAYGSNLDPRLMAQRAPSSPMAGSGWIEGWRLTFAGADVGWDGALATVVEAPGERVFVVLYDVTSQDERALDQWEGTDIVSWRKLRARVRTLDGDLVAWLYVLQEWEGGLPSAHYLSVIADAAEAGGAPADYVAGLRMLPCRGLDD